MLQTPAFYYRDQMHILFEEQKRLQALLDLAHSYYVGRPWWSDQTAHYCREEIERIQPLLRQAILHLEPIS